MAFASVVTVIYCFPHKDVAIYPARPVPLTSVAASVAKCRNQHQVEQTSCFEDSQAQCDISEAKMATHAQTSRKSRRQGNPIQVMSTEVGSIHS